MKQFGVYEHSELDDKSSEIEEMLSGLKDEQMSLEEEAIRAHIEQDDDIAFYRIQPGDTLISIHNRLKRLDEFAYLNNPGYDPSVARNRMNGWNIKPEQLRAGFRILIPMDLEMRDLSQIDYATSLNNIQKNFITNDRYNVLDNIVKKSDSKHVQLLIETFVTMESGKGKHAYSRWEEGHKSYSYTGLHFLFNEGSPFGAAKDYLGYTIGEILSDFDKALTVLFTGLVEKFRQFDNDYRYTKNNKKVPSFVQKYVKNEFPGGIIDMFDKDNMYALAKMYNGISTAGGKYADKFLLVYEQLRAAKENKPTETQKQKPSKKPQNKKKIVAPKQPKIIETPKVTKQVEKKQLHASFEKHPKRSRDGSEVYTIALDGPMTHQEILESFGSVGETIVTNKKSIDYPLDHRFMPGDAIYLKEYTGSEYEKRGSFASTGQKDGYETYDFTVGYRDVHTSGSPLTGLALRDQFFADVQGVAPDFISSEASQQVLMSHAHGGAVNYSKVLRVGQKIKIAVPIVQRA